MKGKISHALNDRKKDFTLPAKTTSVSKLRVPGKSGGSGRSGVPNSPSSSVKGQGHTHTRARAHTCMHARAEIHEGIDGSAVALKSLKLDAKPAVILSKRDNRY